MQKNFLFLNWVFKQGWAQRQKALYTVVSRGSPAPYSNGVSATQTNLGAFFWGGRHKMPPCKRQVVMICGWGHSARQKMEARASLFRGQCTHSYQPGGRLRTLRNVSRQGVRVWGEYCAIVTLDLTVWHWLVLPPVGPLCLIPVGAHNRPTVYSVNNIKCIEWFLFSHCDMWFWSSRPRRICV